MLPKELFAKFDKKDKLWTSNFFLLWHGQLASGFGDRLYTIALGFWVLAVTKSTALMGILMAGAAIPRIIIPPLAGPLTERMNKKILLVLMNAIRGVLVTMVGVAILIGYIQFWMLFLAGLIINLCGALFNPTVKSSLPNLVPKSKLEKANSITDMIRQGTFIMGNFVGALLIQLMGAAQVFIFNGLSYLISAGAGLLMEFPCVEDAKAEEAASSETEVEYDEKMRGLRYPLLIAAGVNFLGNIGLILFLPLFQKLKMINTGFSLLAGFTLGSLLLGILFTFIVYLPASKRLAIFIGSNFLSGIGYATWPLFSHAPLILGLIFITGLFSAMYNVYITSSIQLTVPEKIRNKVFGLSGMIFPGLAPVAMAVGGILGEFIPIKVIIFASQMLILILITPMASISSFKQFINFDPEKQTLADLV